MRPRSGGHSPPASPASPRRRAQPARPAGPAGPARGTVPAWLLPAAVLALAAGLIFTDLGSSSLHNRDEARHALVAENILADGDWLTLHYEGAPYFNKAPLKFWLTALAFRACGVNEWTARLWSALFALGAVALTGLLGARLYDRRTGLLAMLVLATSPQFLHSHCARTGEQDSALLFCWTLACLLIVAGLRRRPLFYLGCAAVGLCGMVKHLGFVPELLLVLGLWLGLSGQWRALGAATLLKGLAAALAVALPWHTAQAALHGGAFLDRYLGREMVHRGLTFLNVRHDARFFLFVLKDGLYPWSLLLPLAVWRLTRSRAPLALRPGLLPAIWALVVLVVISISRVKLSWYALPAYPALAILLARFVTTEWLSRPTRPLDVGVALTWAVLVLSPVNVGIFNPSGISARDGMIETDLLGFLQGAPVGPWPGPLLLGVAALGTAAAALACAGRPTGRLAAGARRAAFAALCALALLTAAAPLRFAATRGDLDRLVRRARAVVGPTEVVEAALPAPLARDERTEFYLRRLPGRRREGAAAGAAAAGAPAPARWRLGVRDGGAPAGGPAGAPRSAPDAAAADATTAVAWEEALREGEFVLWRRR